MAQKTPNPIPLVLVALRGTLAKFKAERDRPAPSSIEDPKEWEQHCGMRYAMKMAIDEQERLIAAVVALAAEE